LKQQNKPTATKLTKTLATAASLRSRCRREGRGGREERAEGKLRSRGEGG
jgi:hypothetical protein